MLGKPRGIFDLKNSDKYCGSYIKKQDLQLMNLNLDNLKFKTIDKEFFIDERELHKKWKFLKCKYNVANFDELILLFLIKLTYPDAIIETQYKISKYKIDFRIEIKNKEFFIELDGPSHFVISKFGVPKDPRFKRDKLLKDSNIKIINWPYWIQRCSKNLKVIVENAGFGNGALWSSLIHFGDFIYEDSSELIEELSEIFNCQRHKSYGYFYEEWSLNEYKPEHKIIEDIRNKKQKLNRIIPKNTKHIEKWVPKSLLNFL